MVLEFNIDFSRIQTILKNSLYEVEAEILNNKGDLYLLPEKRAKPYLDKFPFIERFPFNLSHYFMLFSKNPFFNEIKTALFSIDKNIIRSLGFEEIEEVNIWIKFFSLIIKIFPQLIEKSTILETFLNVPFLVLLYIITLIFMQILISVNY